MIIVAIDIGYSNLKIVVGERGSPSANLKQLVFPVGAAPLEMMGTTVGMQRDRSDGFEVLVEGEPYIAGVAPGRLQQWNRVLHEDYASHKSYRALFHAGLIASGADVIDILVTGLPVNQAMDKKRVAALEKSLMGNHQVRAGKFVEVKKVKVVMQPVGGYLDLLWREPAMGDKDLGVCVFDPGHFSVDWVNVRGGALRDKSSGTSHLATSVVLDKAAALLREQHDIDVTPERIERTLRGGTTRLNLFTQSIDMLPTLKAAAATTAPQVVDAMRQSLRAETESIDVFYIVGGGGELYKDAIGKAFPRAKVLLPKEPVFANARGFWVVGARNLA